MLGGIGSLLTLLAIIPTAGVLLAIIGLVLTLIAVKYASDIFGDPKIFNNMLYAVIIGIVGLVIAGVTVVSAVFSVLNLGITAGVTPPANLQPGDFAGLVETILIGLVAVWACMIVSSIFLRRSYTELSKRVNVGLFSTAALLYLIGAVLVIAVVGFLLIFIADILFLIAFFSINTQQPPAAPMTQPAQPTM